MSQLRNKFFKLFLAAGLILTVMGGVSAQTQISSCQDFQDIDNNPSATYSLTSNIDCSGFSFDPVTFSGVVNGNDYTVSNIDINIPGDGKQSIFNTPSGDSSELNSINFDNINADSTGSNIFPSILFSQTSLADFNDNTYILNDVVVQNSQINYGSGSYAGIIASRGNLDIQDVEVINSSIDSSDSNANIGLVSSQAYANSTVSNLVVQNSQITGGLGTGAFFRDVEGGTYNNLYSINNDITSGLPTGFAYEVIDSDISTVVIDGGTIKNNDDRGARGLFGEFGGLGSNSIVNGVKIQNLDLGRVSGNDGANAIIGGGSGEINNAYVEGGSLDSLNGDSAVVSLTGSLTLNNFYVADTSSLDLVGSDDFFANGPSGYTYSGLYYDSQTTSVSNTVATGLTTSEMTGASAENNMPEFDFVNEWATQDNDYPELRDTIVQEPDIYLKNPADGSSETLFSDVNFEFDVTTGGEEGTVEISVEKPDSSEETVFTDVQGQGITNRTYNEIYQPQQVGSYTWTVTVSGSQTSSSESRSFTVPEPSPPEYNLVSPVNTELETYDSSETYDFDFSINNAEVSGNYKLQLRNQSGTFENVSSGTYSTGDNDFVDSVNVEFPASGTQNKEWRVFTNDSINTDTSSISSFSVRRLEEPTVTIERPNDGEVFYVEEGNSRQIPFEGWINGSEETGEAFGEAVRQGGSVPRDSLGQISVGDNFVSGDVLTDANSYSNAKIEFVTDSGVTFSSSEVSFDIINANPVVTEFNVTSDEVQNLENIQPGDFFDITLEGEIKRDEIDYIEYRVEDSSGTVLDSRQVQSSNFYQDDNIFTNNLDDAFEMKEAWAGKTLDFEVNAVDTQGLESALESQEVQTGTPPDEFLLNSPDIGEFFLIPEGQNEVSVDIDYGVDSNELAGDLKLYVNGQQQATESVAKNTEQNFTYTDTYTEGTQTWYLEWTDSTGETYTSSTSNFEVSEYPLGLSLDSPSQGETVQIDTEPGTVDHDFTVSSDAFTGDWYYEFRLTNGNGTVVEQRTSEVFSGVTQQFTEQVDGIEEGSYTYNVSVYDDSDNGQIVTRSKSYDTVFDPLFNQEIDSPGDGNTYLVQPGETRNVSYGLSVETFDDATDFTLSLDGSNVTTESVGTQSSDTFTGEFTGLGTGTYNVELTGEDASGRTNSTSVSFSVEEAESENESVEINTIEFSPRLEEARPGDELDVYIEGSGTPENVDFVEIELEIAGDTETIIVPTDELQEGSWFWEGENQVTVKESWAGAKAKITGTVTDVAGRTSRFFREYVLGSELEMFGVLETPRNGEVYLRENGTDNPIEFTGEVRAGFDNIVYEVQANDQNLFGGSLSPEESTEFSQFVAPSQWTLDQFGEYKATLLLTNSETNEQKSYTNTFEIVEDTGQPVVTISDPGQNAQIETPRGENDAEVTLRYRIQTNQSGTTSLVLENLDEGRQQINIGDIDEQVSDQEASSGEAFRTVDTTLDRGTYLMRASFEDASGQNASRERTFQVVEDAYEPEAEVSVDLVEPQEGEEIPKGVGTKIEWRAVHNQSVGVPNSTFYVEDSGDNIVFTDTRDAPNTGEGNVYSGYLDADLQPGDYQFYADLKLDSQTLQTQMRNLTVLDSQAPETSLQNQDLGTFRQGEDGVADIEAQFTTETFQQDVTLELVTRPEGTNDGTVRLTAQQEGFREISRNASWNEFEPGEYEYYVRMEANPTYTSDTGTYTVEKTAFDDPLIQLDRPEQGETFTYNDTNASVPFKFDAEAYTQSQTNFTLLLETVSEDNSELESIDSFTLNEEDGLREYNENFELEESGYRYQVIAEYEDETWSSDTRSFVVDNEETVDTPEMPTAGEGFGIISRISDFGERLLGNQSDFILGFGLLLITSVGVTVRTRSDKIGLATMVGVALGLSYVGVFPSWIAAVFTLISVGISVWTVNLLVGGKGEL